MTSSPGAGRSGSAASDQESPEFKEYVVQRDGDRPLSFAGQCLAHVKQTGVGVVVHAAMYRTRGGKFVTALWKDDFGAKLFDVDRQLQDLAREVPRTGSLMTDRIVRVYHKAAVFETFEEAADWFRPGPLTDALRKDLGLNEPVRIE